jgi:signal transduction histidine kinase
MRHRLPRQAGIPGSLAIEADTPADLHATTGAARAMTIRERVALIAREINQPLAAIMANAEACLGWLAVDPPDMA